MKVNNAEFAHCVATVQQMPETGLPEVAFAGRSNVGKSSLINSLLNRKSLARTSGQPGKTQTLNFYLVNDNFYLVDLPGYGYAKVPHSVRDKWKRLLEGYLSKRNLLRGVVLLVDSRHDPLEADLQMFQWLRYYNKPLIVVATKVDKLKQKDYKDKLNKLEQAYFQTPIIPFSSVKGIGKSQLWSLIDELVGKQGDVE
ncbi:MAG: YihA family ribosome biogenesis GTP-binding protein [Firmicutes bacterium]|nr:YihA family ribosome biogenesis GTP-binding protein [Bacillota bacterium]